MRTIVAAAVLFLLASARADASNPYADEIRCLNATSSALATCAARVGNKNRRCYLQTGAPCPSTAYQAALDQLEKKVVAKCTDAPSAGFGPLATGASVAARLQEACVGDPASVHARTFGGPQAALLPSADAATKKCLAAAAEESVKLLKRNVKVINKCQRAYFSELGGGAPCPVFDTQEKLDANVAKSQATVGAACPNLASILGYDSADYVGRAAAQARCMGALSSLAPGALALDCGPRGLVPPAPRGTWTQVVLDEAFFGTRCGDGTPYAFWLKLAPAGSPVGRVVVDLEGGGVCLAEGDCAGVPTSLFQATDNAQPSTGYMSTNPTINPFADWTQIFLPYCTQDVHIGGGGQSVFTSLTVNRFGSVNVRAALRYLRDALWPVLVDETAEGYRPDRLTVLFGGESAGAFGVQYNYHYLLDDLRWAHTTAAPDAGLALDNGTALSVRSLGILITSSVPPSTFAWLSRPFLPAYCQTGGCAVGPELQVATSVRLKAVPEQQILNISNQVDDTQVGTTFFPDTASWINAARDAYCANQGLNGIRAWLPAQTASFHTILRTNSRYTTVTADGVTVRDFLAAAMASPDAVVDRVDEGTLVADYPGVNPIACLGSASGAFLD